MCQSKKRAFLVASFAYLRGCVWRSEGPSGMRNFAWREMVNWLISEHYSPCPSASDLLLAMYLALFSVMMIDAIMCSSLKWRENDFFGFRFVSFSNGDGGSGQRPASPEVQLNPDEVVETRRNESPRAAVTMLLLRPNELSRVWIPITDE